MVETVYSVEALEGIGQVVKLLCLCVVGGGIVASEGENLSRVS
jgi:hypothetical protein